MTTPNHFESRPAATTYRATYGRELRCDGDVRRYLRTLDPLDTFSASKDCYRSGRIERVRPPIRLQHGPCTCVPFAGITCLCDL